MEQISKFSSTMESRNHLKNGANPKSQMIRGNNDNK